jgi:hypothetical protein
MKNIVNNIIFGRENKFNGLIALALVGLIALGCTCGKGLTSDSGKDSDTGSDETASNKTLPTFGKDKTDKKDKTTSTDDKNDADEDTTDSGDREEIPADKGNDILTNGKLQPLVKNTLMDFADAVEKGDFADFHADCSKPFKKQFTAEKMTNEFKVFIDKKDLAVPILRQAPTKELIMAISKVEKKNGFQILTAAGSIPTSPSITSFDNKYILENGVWRIIEVEVRMK